jgi:hypothetical protein
MTPKTPREIAEAWKRIEGMAARWNDTPTWHEPPFYDGTIEVTTRELHAASIVAAERARLGAELANWTERSMYFQRNETKMEAELEAAVEHAGALAEKRAVMTECLEWIVRRCEEPVELSDRKLLGRRAYKALERCYEIQAIGTHPAVLIGEQPPARHDAVQSTPPEANTTIAAVMAVPATNPIKPIVPDWANPAPAPLPIRPDGETCGTCGGAGFLEPGGHLMDCPDCRRP